jgi:protein-tyrosine phosphatase
MPNRKPIVRVSFVCLGNICRSPTAEAVMRHLVKEAGLEDRIQVDSAGTGDWHIGEARDPRSTEVGQRRGIPLSGQARQWKPADFARFDYVLAMDRKNRAALLALAPDREARDKVRLLREFDPQTRSDDDEVPDPYFGGPDGFDRVFDICGAACRALLQEIRQTHGL